MSRTKVYTYQGVRYVARNRPAPLSFIDPMVCGSCGRTWDDSQPTAWTPTPSGRCPFEYMRNHGARL